MDDITGIRRHLHLRAVQVWQLEAASARVVVTEPTFHVQDTTPEEFVVVGDTIHSNTFASQNR